MPGAADQFAHRRWGQVQLTSKLRANHCQFFHCQIADNWPCPRAVSLLAWAFNDFCVDVKSDPVCLKNCDNLLHLWKWLVVFRPEPSSWSHELSFSGLIWQGFFYSNVNISPMSPSFHFHKLLSLSSKTYWHCIYVRLLYYETWVFFTWHSIRMG